MTEYKEQQKFVYLKNQKKMFSKPKKISVFWKGGTRRIKICFFEI